MFQISFIEDLSLNDPDVICAIRADLEPSLPVSALETHHDARGFSNAVQRYSDREGRVRAAFGPSFIAVETRDYATRDGFLSSLLNTLDVVAKHAKPGTITRLGARFVNRGLIHETGRLNSILREGMAGPSSAFPNALVTLCEAHIPCDEGMCAIRYAELPPGASPDANIVEPLTVPNWVFDIDVFTTADTYDREHFSSERAVEFARRLTDRAENLFEWSFTPEFLALRTHMPPNKTIH